MKDSLLTYYAQIGTTDMRRLHLNLTIPQDCEPASLEEKRRLILQQLLHDSAQQGARLSYKDLSLIMLTSKATLKRDVKRLKGRAIQTHAIDT